MATAGASGVSLALGIYNTTQIASLKETIESISVVGGGGTALAPTVLKPVEVVRPADTLNREAFRQASSSEVKELQERLRALESFSSSVNSSSASNSTGLATKLGELELFANATSTRSSTNENNIVMLNDELDRLQTFTGEQIPKVRERVATAEESMQTNTSGIETLSTRTGDLESGVSAADNRIDAVVALTSAIESSLNATTTSVAQSAGAIEQVSTSLTALTQGVDKLGDAIDLVDGNEEETRKNLAALSHNYNVLKSRAYVTAGTLNAVNLRATRCKLGLDAHDGEKSALHFAGLGNPNWAMYCTNAAGKGPDGKKVHPHGEVTTAAVRLRMADDPKCGFVVENDKSVGVFSVNMQGNTRMGSGRIADVSGYSYRATGFGHYSQTGLGKIAIAQTAAGETIVNAPKGQNISFRVDNNEVVRMNGLQLEILNAGHEAPSTCFNQDGTNIIVCGTQGSTVLNAGGVTHAFCSVGGFYAGRYHVARNLENLSNRVLSLEAQIGNKLDMTKTVRFFNHATQAYSGKDGRPNAPAHDSNAHYSIHYD